MTKKKNQDDLKIYATALAAFIIFMACCIMVFFYYVQKDVMKDTKATIAAHVEQQSLHFQSVINVHFDLLAGMARYAGEQEELTGAENMKLIQSVSDESQFELLAVIDSEGKSTYDNGATSSVSEREYFKKAMEGEQSLSDPLESKVDGESRVILSVPIYKEKQVVGVMSGSFNVGSLSNLLFEDIYNNAGYCYITTKSGTLVTLDIKDKQSGTNTEDNFFDYYVGKKLMDVSDVERIREDFANQRSGHVGLDKAGDKWYMTYEPLYVNDWMLCYVVPVNAAQESYDFIRRYELTLSLTLALGVACLMLCIVRVNNRTKRRLLRYANTDELTGCRNKKNTEDKINEWLQSPECEGCQAFFMMDIDKFKEINDEYGHAVGDEVLRRVGEALHSNFRDDDILGRIGGDEFVILMRNVNSEDNIVVRAERLSRLFREMQIPEMNNMGITLSMGISLSPKHGKTYNELYVCADRALYRTKDNGRNGFTMYQE